MIFTIPPSTFKEMLVEANAVGWPHYLEQCNQENASKAALAPLVFAWQVDGNESGYGKTVVTLNLDGTWSATLTRYEPDAVAEQGLGHIAGGG